MASARQGGRGTGKPGRLIVSERAPLGLTACAISMAVDSSPSGSVAQAQPGGDAHLLRRTEGINACLFDSAASADLEAGS